jgi:hypothetical protein
MPAPPDGSQCPGPRAGPIGPLQRNGYAATEPLRRNDCTVTPRNGVTRSARPRANCPHPSRRQDRRGGVGSRRLCGPPEWPLALVCRQLARDRPQDSEPRPRGKSRSATLQTGRRGVWQPSLGMRPSASEDDLRVIAEHGYEGAASADLDPRAQAVGLFITDMLAALDRPG